MKKEPTKIYILVNGTCTAGPDENLFEKLGRIGAGEIERPYSEKLGRKVTGGGTALWVKSPGGIYMIDSGDFDDRKILQKSLEKIAEQEGVDPIKSVRSIYSSHAHGDHSGNHELFPEARWMIDAKDPLFDVIYGVDVEDAGKWAGHREVFKGNRDRGIIVDRFSRYADNDHPGKPQGLRIIDTPGHDHVHKSFAVEDDEVVVINLETGEEYMAPKVVFAGDCLCDERYLKRFLGENPETAIYGNVVPLDQWAPPKDQAERDMLDRQNLESMERLVQEGRNGLLIFGHGGVYDPNS
ncbi:MBL fold metallo-hydrolase [Candidatus Woesearchaeota archaeon]|nr:MBL fold metallo-hydrolase [Candidatus Woesearchaeota archaeon]